ncbi:MAG: hypothetical protein U1F11_05970 [Steroidobacteraceae bacterium]
MCTLAAHREHEIGFVATLRHARNIVQGDDPKFDLPGLAPSRCASGCRTCLAT